MRVLLTGVGGFIGSHTVRWILEHTDWDLIGLESGRTKDKHGPSQLQSALAGLSAEQLSRFAVHRWDLTRKLLSPIYNEVFKDNVDVIISMASDSRVTYSVHHPGETWFNNCQLAYNTLEVARKHQHSLKMFIQVSTDEVYGDAGWDDPGHPEWDTILPTNPYSASKAAQEALAIAYWRTYGVPVVIANTMNVIGEWQDPAKFLPLAIKRIEHGEPMTLFGEAGNKATSRRCWLDVKNMAAAMVHICKEVKPNRCGGPQSRPYRFHVVGKNEFSVKELATLVADKLGKPLIEEIVQGDKIRLGYDRRYALEDNNLKATGFKPPFDFDETLSRIIDWARSNPNWIFENL